jgi:hypothetical protein
MERNRKTRRKKHKISETVEVRREGGDLPLFYHVPERHRALQ